VFFVLWKSINGTRLKADTVVDLARMKSGRLQKLTERWSGCQQFK